jgi:hypothetical protein
MADPRSRITSAAARAAPASRQRDERIFSFYAGPGI